MLLVAVTILFGFIIILYMVSPLISPSYINLKELHVLITGGSSGIGKFIAIESIKQGANVTILARNQEKLYEAKFEIEKHMIHEYQKVTCISIDVSKDYLAVKSSIEKAEINVGRYVDVLINCAGYANLELFDKMQVSEFKNLMDVNYLGTIYATKAVIENMKANANATLTENQCFLNEPEKTLNGQMINVNHEPRIEAVKNSNSSCTFSQYFALIQSYFRPTLNKQPEIDLPNESTSILRNNDSNNHNTDIINPDENGEEYSANKSLRKKHFDFISEKISLLNYMHSFFQCWTTSKHVTPGYRIMFVSSQAGQAGLYGCSAYCASKFALRGLAESLQMEVKPYNIRITIAYPPDTDTPGYALENLTKPTITKDICQTSGLFSPQIVAHQLLEDCKYGKFTSFIGMDGFMLQSLTCGMSPITSMMEAILQVATMSLFRIVGLFYIDSFDRMIKSSLDR